MSPVTEPFDTLFTHAILNELPCAIANSALFGGSGVRVAHTASGAPSLSLQRLAAPEEALLIVDLDLEAQFQKRGSVRTPEPCTVVARKALLFPAVAGHAELVDLVAHTEPHFEARLASLCDRSDLPAIAREQLAVLLTARRSGTATPADVRLLLDALPLPPDVVPFWNRCEQSLQEANTVVAQVLAGEPANRHAMEAIRRIGLALDQAARLSSAVLHRPSPIRSEMVDTAAPFVDRDHELAKLTTALRDKAVVLLHGLPGIGKKTLVNAALRELFPLRTARHIHCVPGMEARQLLEALSAAVTFSPEQLTAARDSTKRRIEALVVVHDLEHCYGKGDAASALSEYLDRLSETASRIVLLATRQVDAPYVVVHLSRLTDDHIARILEYYCKALGVAFDQSLVTSLHGYPLAAKLAAQLLRSGRREAFDRLRFLKRIREEVVRLLLEEITLSDAEKRTIEALAVFRRPIPPEARDALGLSGMEGSIATLESKFLIERDGEELFVMPLVREVAVDAWLPRNSATDFHRAAAEYYKAQLHSPDAVKRHEAREEAVYHLSSLRDFDGARLLGADWSREARAASRDLYRRRSYRQAIEVCQQVLETQPADVEVLGRAVMAAARLKDWRSAAEFLKRLRRTGQISAYILTGYGETLLSSGVELEGRALIEEAVLAYPDDAYATAALADIHLANNDLDEAREQAARALELDARSLRALEVSSKIARRLGNHEQAFKFARRAMEIDPRRAETIYNKAKGKLNKKYDGKIPPEILE